MIQLSVMLRYYRQNDGYGLFIFTLLCVILVLVWLLYITNTKKKEKREEVPSEPIYRPAPKPYIKTTPDIFQTYTPPDWSPTALERHAIRTNAKFNKAERSVEELFKLYKEDKYG